MGSLLQIPHYSYSKPHSQSYYTISKLSNFVSLSSIINHNHHHHISFLSQNSMSFPSTSTQNQNQNPIFSLHFHAPFKRTRPTKTINKNFIIRASSGEIPSSTTSKNKNKSIIFFSVLTAVLGVGNRVLYKLALVPLKEYPFFLAQFITFGYVAIYFSILFIRHHAGIVTNEMLAIPKWRFVLIGFLEALGAVVGMSAAAMLPGPAIPILSQTFLVWQLLLSTIILGSRYSFRQIVGCLLVATGVILAVSSGSDGGQMVSRVEFMWPVLMIASSAFQAGASILKEFIFVDAAKRLKGKSLDIFVVNSFGSGCQALFVLLCLPVLSNLKGIPFNELPQYLKSGAGCFLNIGVNNTGCDGAPLLPLLYVANNIAFNISVLNLLKTSSAVVASLVVMVSVPVSIYVLSLPLPYLPQGASLTPFFLFGSVVLMLGLILYNLPQPSKQSS